MEPRAPAGTGGAAGRDLDRSLVLGALLWLGFCGVAVALRGVRWEETWEHAILITRLVPYDDGHPHFRFIRNLPSLQAYFSAAIAWVAPSPLLINGLRNLAQLAFATLPLFALGTWLSGRAWVGHAAAALALLGVHLEFASYYPMFAWPYFFSVGQIGLGWALATLALLVFGHWRAGWCALGVLGAVHLGQVPPLLALGGLQLGWAWREGERDRVADALRWGVAGAAVSASFYLVHRLFWIPAPTAGPFFAEGDARAIWAAYSLLFDLHRLGPPAYNPFGHSNLALIGGLLLAAAAARALRSRPWTWLCAYVAIVALLVWSVRALHLALGSDIPQLLIGWMPYRLPNHVATLLVPMTLAILADRAGSERDGEGVPWPPLLALLAGLVLVGGAFDPEARWQRHVGGALALALALMGAAAVRLARSLEGERAFRRVWLGCAAAALAGLALYAPWLAAAAALGAGAGLTLRGSVAPRWAMLATAALVAALLGREVELREHLPVTPFQRKLVEYLAERGEPDAMLVTPIWTIEWLARTRHPVMADQQTAIFMAYLPELAPSLRKLHLDIFGLAIDAPHDFTLPEWPRRTTAEWQRLGREYGFHYVVSPSVYPLRLERVLRSRDWSLYRVPGVDGAARPG
jgi:hypothetical protein